MPVQFYNGKVLFTDNNVVGMESDCCCSGTCGPCPDANTGITTASVTISNYEDAWTNTIPVQPFLNIGAQPIDYTINPVGSWVVQGSNFGILNHTAATSVTFVADENCNNANAACSRIFLDRNITFLGTIRLEISYVDINSADWTNCGAGGTGFMELEVWSIFGQYDIAADGTPSQTAMTYDVCGNPQIAEPQGGLEGGQFQRYSLHMRISALTDVTDFSIPGCPGTAASAVRTIGFGQFIGVNDTIIFSSYDVSIAAGVATDEVNGWFANCFDANIAASGTTDLVGIRDAVISFVPNFGVPYGVTGQETTVQTIPFYPHHQITNCPDDASGGLGIFGIPVVCTDPSHLSIWKTQQRFIGWDEAYDPAYVSGPTFQWAFA